MSEQVMELELEAEAPAQPPAAAGGVVIGLLMGFDAAGARGGAATGSPSGCRMRPITSGRVSSPSSNRSATAQPTSAGVKRAVVRAGTASSSGLPG